MPPRGPDPGPCHPQADKGQDPDRSGGQRPAAESARPMGSGQLPIRAFVALGHQPMAARVEEGRTITVALKSWVWMDMIFLLTEL